MPYGPVELPRVTAIEIARYERDSLRLRAGMGSKCAPLWNEAADQADLVVQALKTGRDDEAGQAAVKVGPAWKRAADCEGWPTPGVPKASPGQINYPPFDQFTAAHFVVGMALNALGLSRTQAAVVSVGWELVERPLKRELPSIFPHSTQDTLPNMIGDAIAMYLGYRTAEELR